MNQKEKRHQINKHFMSLTMFVCFVVLLLAAPAPAGPTTGQLQQQIDELTAYVNRLRTLIEDPCDASYFAGVATFSKISECVDTGEQLEGCELKTVILIDVLEEQEVVLDAGGLDPSVRLEIEKVPSDNPLTSHDYQVNVQVIDGEDYYLFNVSPDDPIYASNHDPGYPVAFTPVRCELVTDWRIKIIMDFDITELWQICTESNGVITDAHIEPYTESATEAELKVTIENVDDKVPTSYLVTATGFGPFIEPVVAESVLLNQQQTATLTLPIRTVETFAGQGPCLVTLKSMRGKIHDQTTADFPAPLPDPPPPVYIPDFDGDGDVDFRDFSYFGQYWLEGTEP